MMGDPLIEMIAKYSAPPFPEAGGGGGGPSSGDDMRSIDLLRMMQRDEMREMMMMDPMLAEEMMDMDMMEMDMMYGGGGPDMMDDMYVIMR